MKPKVAIVVVTWNRKEDCLNCLNSLQNLIPPEPSIIVVDNCSSDGTSEAIREKFSEVTILSSSRNLGFTGGNNLGIKKALAEGADYVCLLNNDTVVEPGFLMELLKFGRRIPQAGILGPRILYYDRPGIIWSQGISVHRVSGRIYSTGNGLKESDIHSNIAQVSAVSGAAMLLKGKMLREIGLLDEDYYLCFEDIDLCLRAERKGYKIYTVPSSRVFHKVSESMGGEYSEMTVYYATRNHLLVGTRIMGGSIFLRWLRTLLILVYTFLFAAVTSGVFRREKIEAWRQGVIDYFHGRYGARSLSD